MFQYSLMLLPYSEKEEPESGKIFMFREPSSMDDLMDAFLDIHYERNSTNSNILT